MFWQVLIFVAVAVLAIWVLGVGLISAFSLRAVSQPWNIILGIPLTALAIWIPFAFGWVAS